MKNMTRGILAALLAATASTGFAQSLATPTSGNNPSNDSTSIGTSISTGIAQPPARPSSCTDTPYSWTVGGNTCSGVIPSAYSGSSSQAANTTSGYSGFASFACYNGTWQGPDTSSDSCAPVQAAAPVATAAASCPAKQFGDAASDFSAFCSFKSPVLSDKQIYIVDYYFNSQQGAQGGVTEHVQDDFQCINGTTTFVSAASDSVCTY